MSKIATIEAEIDDLQAEASAIIDRMEAGDESLEDQARLDQIDAELVDKRSKITAAARLAERRRAMAPAAGRPALSLRTDEPDPAMTGGFRSLAEFATAVRSATVNGEVDRRLAAPSNLHQGGGADGEGFLLPAEYRQEIWSIVRQDEFLNRFRLDPTVHRSVEFVKDESTPWGAAGVSAYWRSEGSQMTASKAALKGGRMELHDLYAMAEVTDELMSDAPRLEGHLQAKAAEAITWTAGEAVLRGDGVGKPLGILTSDALVSVAKQAGQANNTIVSENITGLYARFLMVPGSTGRFFLSRTEILPQLMQMKIGEYPIYMPPGGLASSPYGTLMGLPLLLSEHADAIGAVGDLTLIDPAGYMASVRQAGVDFATSIHLYFDYGAQAFRWRFRMGGQPMLSAPVSPAKGAATKSHFVAIAARQA